MKSFFQPSDTFDISNDFANDSLVKALEINNKHLLTMCLNSKSISGEIEGLLKDFELLKKHCYS